MRYLRASSDDLVAYAAPRGTPRPVITFALDYLAHLDRHLHDLVLCQIFHAGGVGIVTFGKMTCSRKQCDSAFR